MSVVSWSFFVLILSRSDFNYKINTLLKGCDYARLRAEGSRTPADAEVNVEVVPLGEDGDDQQAVQIQTLHQQPVVVGQYAVLHHHHCNPAADRRLKPTCCFWVTESFQLNFNLPPPFRFICIV